ncbi:MAG: DUF6505 family protein [Rhodobacteraceae bacterium]|nr:DUF6505 family protein [Paracoccaceae bacterium]
MKFSRAIHFDESDRNTYFNSARTGEWCIPGSFEFSNWSRIDLQGKARQAFASGWLGLETFGRVTFVAVTTIEPLEIDSLVRALARHFVEFYGAPTVDAAAGVARGEIEYMIGICRDHPINTVMSINRELVDEGVRERFRTIKPKAAGIEQFAIHLEPHH